MSSKFKNKIGKNIQAQEEKPVKEDSLPQPTPSGLKKVKMVFTEAKFYNDLNFPIFEPGKVYEIEGADQIERWVKRGGAIVCENTNKPVSMDSDNKQKVEETIPDEDVSSEKVEAKEDVDLL